MFGCRMCFFEKDSCSLMTFLIGGFYFCRSVWLISSTNSHCFLGHGIFVFPNEVHFSSRTNHDDDDDDDDSSERKTATNE